MGVGALGSAAVSWVPSVIVHPILSKEISRPLLATGSVSRSQMSI